jgi:hypothetical protein
MKKVIAIFVFLIIAVFQLTGCATMQELFDQRIEIEQSLVTPQAVSPGSTIETEVRYTVSAPFGTQQITVTETRELVIGNERLVLSRKDMARTPGTHTSIMKFTLPKDIESGNYALLTTVSIGRQTKSVMNTIKVMLKR